MAETEKPDGEGAVPPTVPIRNINVPDPTTGGGSKDADPVKDAEREPDHPDAAARDGLA